MPNTEQKDELTRVRVALVINLMATLVSFLVLMDLIGTHVMWRIVFGAVACTSFACFTMWIYSRFTRLQKEQKQQEQRVS
jgi:hypothetical protein